MNKIIHAKLICTSSFTDAEKQEADNILKEKYADYKGYSDTGKLTTRY